MAGTAEGEDNPGPEDDDDFGPPAIVAPVRPNFVDPTDGRSAFVETVRKATGWTKTPPPANQVEQALQNAPAPARGEWKLVGPTKVGAFIVEADGKQVATVVAADFPPPIVEQNARVIVRSLNMRTILEHVETELQGDDEGTRWRDLLALIGDELRRAGRT
jgi:hypothetical protein